MSTRLTRQAASTAFLSVKQDEVYAPNYYYFDVRKYLVNTTLCKANHS